MHQLFSSLALAAALVRSAAAIGCYPAYSIGVTYKAGDWVSNAEGPATYNYMCQMNEHAVHCSNRAFAPGGVHWNGAWIKESTACTVSFDAAPASGVVVLPPPAPGCGLRAASR